ncbi:hypothetical protein [Streptacidiphilus jiangxiensis]|uniref:Uncharacterized protein n=1 Tax=Streptacidiphilus jiangxiensis TaxID=235985 RepID=A0A1H7Y268_STRJI|nr:hypothetical protein [Streptacidiphilus jiangxiensis]SEM40083.1 hypothetical protein SAMN05414137_12667 [Streptacidiphilus jiangxiensis]
MRTPQRDHWLWGVVTILVGLVVVTLGSLLLLITTAIATFLFGWFALPVPLVALVAAFAVLSKRLNRTGAAGWCPECGGVLSPAVIEPARFDASDELRLRAVYTCAVLGHRSWRWADEGGPLRTEREER